MAYVVYWGSGSPVSWRVLLALALKDVPYESHRLDLGAREHRSDAYRALSPRGSFPILVDGERVVRDSLAILVYLDGRHPAPPLFGADPGEAAVVWEAIGEHQDHLGAATEAITRGLFRKNGLDDPAPVRAAVEQAATELAGLDARLAGREWLAGPAPTAVDVVHYPTLHRLLRAAGTARAPEVGLTLDLGATYPNLAAWERRLTALPGVADTYPPHWR